jgi:hypothetical protein
MLILLKNGKNLSASQWQNFTSHRGKSGFVSTFIIFNAKLPLALTYLTKKSNTILTPNYKKKIEKQQQQKQRISLQNKQCACDEWQQSVEKNPQ